jgi:hypothetical protein
MEENWAKKKKKSENLWEEKICLIYQWQWLP